MIETTFVVETCFYDYTGWRNFQCKSVFKKPYKLFLSATYVVITYDFLVNDVSRYVCDDFDTSVIIFW